MSKKGPEHWIREFLRAWNSFGLLGKLILILACFGTTTILTDLSGLIVEWRGLIAEMLSIYRDHIRNPIVNVARFVTFDLLRPTGPVIDAIMLYLIYFLSEKRVIGKLSARGPTVGPVWVADVIMLPASILALSLLLLSLIDRFLIAGMWVYAEKIAILVPIIFICCSFFAWVRHLIWLSKGNLPTGLVESYPLEFYGSQIGQFVQFATPIIVAFLMLVILASINIGLT